MEGEVVCGRCEVVCAEMMEPQERDAWFNQASDRFYFLEVMMYPHVMYGA